MHVRVVSILRRIRRQRPFHMVRTSRIERNIFSQGFDQTVLVVQRTVVTVMIVVVRQRQQGRAFGGMRLLRHEGMSE